VLSHLLKIAFRNIYRQKGYSFINIAGLAIGLSFSTLILLWVQDELSYDNYHSNLENIYQIEEDQYYSGERFHTTVTPFPSAPVLEDEIPEILETARYMPWLGEVFVRHNDKIFPEINVVAADAEFFKIFSYKFIQGNKETALVNSKSIVIDEEIANKYFGNENPVGKTLTINNTFDFEVTAVMEKVPSNSTYTFNMVFPFTDLKAMDIWSDSWGNNSIFSFVALQPGASIPDVNKKMTEILKRNNEGTSTEFLLFPFKDKHLYSYGGYGKPDTAVKYVYVFSAIALFVLLIACINFMNLSTAKSANRAKEIGVRKAIGGLRASLVKQFYGESIIMALLSSLAAFIIVVLLLSPFNDITSKSISFIELIKPDFLFGFFAITLLTGIISGSYPALYLSSFQPIKVLRGTLSGGSKSSKFRKSLVVIQFTVSIGLIVSTAIVFNQLNFMRNKNLGYNQEQLVYVSVNGKLKENYKTIKNEFAKVSSVLNVTGSRDRPALYGSNSGGINWQGKDPEATVLVSFSGVDYDYTETLEIKMKEGRSFSPQFPADMEIDSLGNFLVNESLAKIMGDGSALGKSLDFLGLKGQIVGVMEDYHFSKVSSKIQPLALYLSEETINYIILKIKPDNLTSTMDQLTEAWHNIYSDYPFEFKFLNDDLDKMYRSETRMFDLLKYFAIVAIIIACLGLYGLASFAAEQRTKEIGIRKVLGASEFNLALLISKEFVILVSLSNLIAWPLSFYLMKDWLDTFAYRINLSIYFFVIAGLTALIITILTVSYQAFKAAYSNPVKSLRSE